MPEWMIVILQGVVQGVTEFLPVSSTGHLLVVSALLDFEIGNEGTFEIFIQVGTLVAVLAYYRQSLWQQVRTVRTDQSVQRLWMNVVLASIPIAVLGFLFLNFIETQIFPQDRAPIVIAITLILGGIIFLVIEQRPQPDPDQLTTDLQNITWQQAIIIGIAQAFALIPGTSRSGASIVGALLVGLDRPTATAFSFYAAIPVLGGATVLQLIFNLDEVDMSELAALFVGAVVAGMVAWVTIGWLLRFVANHDFKIFGYYRIIAGVILILMIVAGIL
mgnify:CR=1 FL=1